MRIISVTISSTVGGVVDDELAATGDGRLLKRDFFEGVLDNKDPDCGKE